MLFPSQTTPSEHGFQVVKIQEQEEQVDLQQQIVDGLLSSSPRMPSLLLWNDPGQVLFDKFSQTPSYYLNKRELEILSRQADDIVRRVPEDGMLIELGCGSLHKTSMILSAFERQQRAVSYYALDVSPSELADSLKRLVAKMGKTTSVKISGLLGTYEDCVTWLATSPSLLAQNSVSFLWMGNSIANLEPREASSLLSRFSLVCSQRGLACQFIVGADACTQKARIMAAYDTTKAPLHDFIMNGLRHANSLIGYDLFQEHDWTCRAEFNAREHVLVTSYTPHRDVWLEINGLRVQFRRGDRIPVITSGKWTEEDMQGISVGAGLHVSDIWTDLGRTYCFYRLQPLLENEGRNENWFTP